MNAVPPRLTFAAATVLLAFCSSVVSATTARRDPDAAADPESPPPIDGEPAPDSPHPPRWAHDAPPAVDAPQLRNVEPRTRVYVDASYAQTPDLSALPNIAGKGRNLRLAVGGSLKWRRFQFDTELPASQATTLDLLDPNSAISIADEERHQTALSIGDFRLGAQWTDALPVDALPLVGGFGLRVRVPTHTTTFEFTNLVDGTLGIYVLPYYFHIEPTLLLGGAVGDFSFVTNQGALILTGPDGQVLDLPIPVPNIYFWDAHLAVAYRMTDMLGLSVEGNYTHQLNDLDPVMFPKLSHMRALFVVPAAQVHLPPYRVDAAARIGLSRGADALGVLGYAGSRSFILRVSRDFD